MHAVAARAQYPAAVFQDPWDGQGDGPEKPQGRGLERPDLVGHIAYQRMVCGETGRTPEHGQDRDQRARQAEHFVAGFGHVEVVVVMRLAANASRRAM